MGTLTVSVYVLCLISCVCVFLVHLVAISVEGARAAGGAGWGRWGGRRACYVARCIRPRSSVAAVSRQRQQSQHISPTMHDGGPPAQQIAILALAYKH